MKASKLTSKYQATIPDEIRNFLALEKGDKVAFEIINDQVVLRKASDIDIQYLNDIASTFSEWSSENDEEAYGEL
mgnify:CR=1 FL=1